MFHDLNSIKIIHYVLDNLLCLFDIHIVIEEWLKKTLYVIYFTKITFGCFMIWPAHKAENTHDPSYCVDCGYIWSLKIDLSRYTVLSVSLIFIMFFAWFDQRKIRHYVLSNLLCWFGIHLVIEKGFKQTHCARYLNNINLGYFTIIPVEKEDNSC